MINYKKVNATYECTICEKHKPKKDMVLNCDSCGFGLCYDCYKKVKK